MHGHCKKDNLKPGRISNRDTRAQTHDLPHWNLEVSRHSYQFSKPHLQCLTLEIECCWRRLCKPHYSGRFCACFLYTAYTQYYFGAILMAQIWEVAIASQHTHTYPPSSPCKHSLYHPPIHSNQPLPAHHPHLTSRGEYSQIAWRPLWQSG